jgi:hypothetical protein
MKLSRKVAAFGFAAATFTGAAVVYAAWTSTVDGTGGAQSTTSDSGDNDLAAVALDAVNNLYPGAVKATQVTVKNDNAYPIEVLQIHAGASRAVDSCAADTVRTDVLGTGSAAVTKVGGGTLIAPAGTGTYELVLRMNNDAADACKSKTFVIGEGTANTSDLVANVRSAASTSGNTW